MGVGNVAHTSESWSDTWLWLIVVIKLQGQCLNLVFIATTDLISSFLRLKHNTLPQALILTPRLTLVLFLSWFQLSATFHSLSLTISQAKLFTCTNFRWKYVENPCIKSRLYMVRHSCTSESILYSWMHIGSQPKCLLFVKSLQNFWSARTTVENVYTCIRTMVLKKLKKL